MDKKNSKVLVTVLTIFISIGVGFGGGYFFRNHQLSRLRGNFLMGGANGAQRFMGNRMGGQGGMMRGGITQGSILSMDEKSITVKMGDGSSKIVLFSETTKYSNSVEVSKMDLKTGSDVTVFGTPNSDGSITATTIQLGSQFGRMIGSPSPAAK